MNLRIKSAVYSYLIFVFIMFSLTQDKILLMGNGSSALVTTCLLIGIYYIISHIYKVEENWKKNNRYSVMWYILTLIVSSFFTFASVMGKQYVYKIELGIWGIVKHDKQNAIKLILVTAGGLIFFFTIIKVIMIIKEFMSLIKLGSKNNVEKTVDFLCGKLSTVKQIVFVFLCWLPHIIINYPGKMQIDGWVSYRQYLGEIPYTTQHPMVYTRLLGNFLSWGKNIFGKETYGLYMLVLMQTALTLFAIWYTFVIFKKINVNKYLRVITMIFFAVVPYFVAYTAVAIVDSIYCPAILIIMDELLWYMYCDKKVLENTAKKVAVYSVHCILLMSAILISFVRYNGTYVIKITLAAVVVRELILIITKRQKVWWTAIVIAVVMLPLMMGQKCVKYINEKYEAEQISTRAMYAIPLQQIARCLVYYQDDITQEEWKDLSRVLTRTQKNIIENYRPNSFDGIKGGFNNEATSKDIKVFLRTWAKIGKRHPGVYVNAVMEQTYYLFSPFSYNQRYYETANQYAVSPKYDMRGVIEENDKQVKKQKDITDYYYSFVKFPVVGILVHQAWYSIVLLGVCICAVCKKKWNVIVLAIPMLVTLLIAFVGPANLGHIRYTFPLMYGMPLLIGAYLLDCKEGEN